MKKILLPVFIFILVAAAMIYFQQQTFRGPSSIAIDDNGVVQLPNSDFFSNENKKQIKRFILRSLDWHISVDERNTSKLSIKYENIKLNTENGLNDFCTLYPTILLILEAPNVSYSGEHPELMIYGTCQSQGRIAKIEFDFVDSKFSLNNWEGEAPDKWRVKHFVYSESTRTQSKNIDLTKYEILSVLGYSIEFPISLKKQ